MQNTYIDTQIRTNIKTGDHDTLEKELPFIIQKVQFNRKAALHSVRLENK